MKLVATQSFGPYVKGEDITDPQAIAEILAGENAANVVKTAAAPVAVPAAE